MTEREYVKLARQARQEYHDQMIALDRVWRMSNGTDPPKLDVTPRFPKSQKKGAHKRTKKNSLDKAIEDAIASFDIGQSFTIRDVEGRISQSAPNETTNRSSVSHALMRIAKESRNVEVVQKGQGRRATIYQRTEGNGSALESAVSDASDLF